MIPINLTKPRLYFRVWDSSNDPVTDLLVAGITSAKYSRYVDGRWAAEVAVGTLADGTNSSAFADGTLVKDAVDALGNLYSIDVATTVVASGADAVRLVVVLSGTDEADSIAHDLGLSQVIKSGEEFVASGDSDTSDHNVTHTRSIT